MTMLAIKDIAFALTSKEISMRRYWSLCFKAKCSVLILIKSRR